MGFQVTSVFAPGAKVYPGMIITYKISPLLGIKLNWMTEITHVKDKVYFVDEQRFGPYSLWHHQHHFKQIDGGIEMTDIVHYRLPFGILGNMAHALSVKNRLKEIFTYRYFKINEIFGDWPGGEMWLRIE